ncbi:MAG: hypothetical protein HeimC3_41880 [Candidatus Heimdallarchaeota archaeon LC_3]|nr:MAG: hypothetical protein HeimC3_41880 [Candidatus Heimdallarchaeota archaeon LC_3]
MVLNLIDINEEIRKNMKDELEKDVEENNVYYSPRLLETSTHQYLTLLIASFETGNDSTLANDIATNNCLKSHEERRTKSGIIQAKVSKNAHEMLAEGEFNRYYIRGLCLYAIKVNKKLKVYRAKAVVNPRIESESKIGSICEPEALLKDLRLNPGVDTALGIPSGPNSGLSVKLV